MKQDLVEDYKFIVNEVNQRYELHVDDHVAFIDFRLNNNKIYLTHTEVPKGLEGQGIGSLLVKQALTDIQQREMTLIPLCPFVVSYIKRHPEWQVLTQ